MPLINCKIELSLNWIENCMLTTAANASSAKFKITDAKLYVPVVALSTEDNAKLTKQLSEGLKRFVYWSEYKITDNKVVEIINNNEEKYTRELLDSTHQGTKRLFVLDYDNTEGNDQVSVDSFKKCLCFLPRVKIENYDIEIDGRNFYDQPINDSIKQYDEIRKTSTGQGDDFTTGCSLDFAYLKKVTD